MCGVNVQHLRVTFSSNYEFGVDMKLQIVQAPSLHCQRSKDSRTHSQSRHPRPQQIGQQFLATFFTVGTNKLHQLRDQIANLCQPKYKLRFHFLETNLACDLLTSISEILLQCLYCLCTQYMDVLDKGKYLPYS